MMALRWTAWPEPLPRRIGWAAFGVLTVFVVGGLVRRLPHASAPESYLAAGLSIAILAVAIFGPRRTRIPAIVVASAAAAMLANGWASSLSWFVIVVLAAYCAVATPPVVTIAYVVAAEVLFVAEAIFGRSDPGWGSWLAGTLFSGIATYLGVRQRELVVELRAAQAGLAQRAQEEERSRIARELHDVIAHSLTVSLLHIGSARLAVQDDPLRAAAALADAERLSRTSLDEVRHAVGLLRTPDATDPRTPLPGSTDVPALIERYRAAGTGVAATVDGDLAGLPATVGLATYRILQEALTNAAKYAGPGPTEIRLHVNSFAVQLSVETPAGVRTGDGTGLGLLGMRERAESLGGTCHAGPAGRGWRVDAQLPLVAP